MGHGFHGYVSHNQRLISDNLLLKWTQPKLGFVETVPRQALRSGACQVDPTKKKRKKHRDPVDV